MLRQQAENLLKQKKAEATQLEAASDKKKVANETQQATNEVTKAQAEQMKDQAKVAIEKAEGEKLEKLAEARKAYFTGAIEFLSDRKTLTYAGLIFTGLNHLIVSK
ncbi:MAG: hypothetical protein AAF770_01625 [Bacteroidota bacterium]